MNRLRRSPDSASQARDARSSKGDRPRPRRSRSTLYRARIWHRRTRASLSEVATRAHGRHRRRRPVSAGVPRRAGWSLFGPSTVCRHPTGRMGASRHCRGPRLLVAQIADRESREPLVRRTAASGLLRGLFHLALQPGGTVRRREPQRLMQARHSGGDLAVADA
jgi:hypothetical protein